MIMIMMTMIMVTIITTIVITIIRGNHGSNDDCKEDNDCGGDSYLHDYGDNDYGGGI